MRGGGGDVAGGDASRRHVAASSTTRWPSGVTSAAAPVTTRTPARPARSRPSVDAPLRGIVDQRGGRRRRTPRSARPRPAATTSSSTSSRSTSWPATWFSAVAIAARSSGRSAGHWHVDARCRAPRASTGRPSTIDSASMPASLPGVDPSRSTTTRSLGHFSAGVGRRRPRRRPRPRHRPAAIVTRCASAGGQRRPQQHRHQQRRRPAAPATSGRAARGRPSGGRPRARCPRGAPSRGQLEHDRGWSMSVSATHRRSANPIPRAPIWHASLASL